jgi:integrase
MPTLKLTKANINKIVPPSSGQVDYFDTELSRFGLRVTKDNMTFMVYKRIRGQSNKTYVPIGRMGEFTPDQARTKAGEYIRRMQAGENPHPKLQPKEETITVDDLYRQYLSLRKTPLADSTRYQYDAWTKNYLGAWMKKDATTITPQMVANRVQELESSAGKAQALNAIKLLSGLYKFGKALHPNTIKANPVEAVKAIRGRSWSEKKRRQTFISPQKLPAWYQAVTEYDNPKGRDFMLLVLFTGLRKMEAATLQWSDIDFKAKTYTFTPEKKKEKAERVTMPMPDQLRRILKLRKAMYYEGDFIFPGKVPSPHVTNVDHWKRDIIEASGVGFCPHDLRRTFITIAESLDIPHYALKALLNHSLGSDVTGGYVCMTVDRLREPMQRIADKIMKLATARVEEEASEETRQAV